MRFVVILLLAPTIACNDSVMTVEGFDKSCEEASDCSEVWTGDVCDCDCFRDAINSSGAAGYYTQWNAIAQECDHMLDCTPCEFGEVDCQDGVCVAID